MMGFDLKWWQKPIFAVLLIIGLGWRLPMFWLALTILIAIPCGGWYLLHHLAWVR